MQRYSERSSVENGIVSNEQDATKPKENVENGGVEVMVEDLPTEVSIAAAPKSLTELTDNCASQVLAAIFRNIASLDLLSCRLVNHKWNELSSYIMRQRADIQIVLPFRSEPQIQQLDQNVSSSMSFTDLIGCLEKSVHFPIANFRFKETEESDNMERFLLIWGQNIYDLGVNVDVPTDIVMLRRLLLEKAPNLRNLHLKFVHKLSDNQNIHLFDDSNEVQLPKLNQLTVLEMSKKDFGIIGDIMKVAPNLEFFDNVYESTLVTSGFKVEEFTLLQSLNKLHCLKRVNLSFDEAFPGFLEKSPQFLNLKFESIILAMNKIFAPYTSRDAEMINKLLCDSSSSLVELLISPVGSIPGIKLTRFENVKKLSLSHDVHDGRCMFPRHFDMAKGFPNLRELVVDIIYTDDYLSTYQPSSVMSTVEFLQILGHCKYDEKLMKMMPNVKTLVLDGEDDELPPTNYGAIISHLTKLENLKYLLYPPSQEELYSTCELDAMITGFSERFCKKMSVQLRDREQLSARELASFETKRQRLSILDLTGLKRLDITLTMNECSSDSDESMASIDDDDDDDDESCDKADEAGFQPGSMFYKTGLTKVTKLLAIDLMPNLKTKIQILFK